MIEKSLVMSGQKKTFYTERKNGVSLTQKVESLVELKFDP